MVTLGLYRSRFERAAALAIDGRLRSAVRTRVESAPGGTGDDSDIAALVTCCDLAGVEPSEVGTVTHVHRGMPRGHDRHAWLSGAGDSFPFAQTRGVSRLRAQALLAAASSTDDGVLLVVNEADAVVAVKQNGQIGCIRKIQGMDGVGHATALVASALGVTGPDRWAELGSIARRVDFDQRRFVQASVRDHQVELSVDLDEVRRTIQAAVDVHGPALADPRSQHDAVQQGRAHLARRWVSSMIAALAATVDTTRCASGLGQVVIGGTLAASPHIASALTARLGNAGLAAVPERAGAALGAALVGHPDLAPPISLALGVAFDDQAIKDALDNCRLEYVYEPKWSRVLGRVSAAMQEGRIVAWFQGATEFGRRSLGSRSVLSDPSSRWARENLNVYLRRRPLSDPIPLSLAPSAADGCVGPTRSPFMLLRATVAAETRGALTAALDEGSSCIVHTPDAETSPELAGLLDVHHARTGVPGLLNIPMCEPDGYLVETPNQAIRFAFGSAVDLIAIGRFLVSKDHWLLRRLTA